MTFRKGYDPNRHQLTDEDRRRGYRAADARVQNGDGPAELLAWMFRRLRAVRRACRDRKNNPAKYPISPAKPTTKGGRK